ncbi:Alpha/Beta hydrolase protein [Lactifluus subvellereus]|nr:Alpha/Beta hydrolase protein [Lactifluus subvellereus]
MNISLPWPLSRFSAGRAVNPTVNPTSTHRRPSSIASLLRYYETPGIPPPFSRVDPLLQQQGGHVMGLRDLLSLGGLIALKATEVAGDVVSHQIWGPRKKSWSLPMTILAGIMRGAGRHSNLVNIATIRMFLGLGGLVPLPPDALVTPVTFRVRKRGLRGILAQFDELEDGTRELSGEWVVTKRLWQRLQAEWKASQTKSRADPSTPPRKHYNERIILYLHGGAYYLFSPSTHRSITIPLSKFTDARIFAVAYRLAPETRFPGSLHDAVSTYFRLLEDLHIPPSNILFAGDSAGGGLCLAVLMYLRDNNYPLPAGAILMSPWVDLTRSCDSWDSNASFDIVPIPSNGDHMDPVACYLGSNMELYLTHPYASPLFGDFTGLPPLLIQAGESEVLRDEVTLLAHKATISGVQVMHELYEDAIHVFQAFPFLEASLHAFLSCRAFVRHGFAFAQPQDPRPLDDHTEAELANEIDNERAHMVRGDGQDKVPSSSKVRDDSEQDTSDATEDESDSSYVSADDSLPVSEEEDGARSTPTVKLQDELRAGDDWDEELSSIRAASNSKSRRVQSYHGLEHLQHISSLMRAQHPSSFRGHAVTLSSRHLRMSTLSSAPVPSPSIRSSSSHPDISSLCEQWESTGPANVTLTYKPSGTTIPASSSKSKGRKRSPSFHHT